MWKSAKQCEKVWKSAEMILPFSCCPEFRGSVIRKDASGILPTNLPFFTLRNYFESNAGVDKRVGFQKGGFGGCSPGTKTGTRVRSRVPPGTKTGTRVHSPKPPFYETALLSPKE